MANSNNKRKERSGGGDDRDKRGPKRSKGGSGGKWQTPHQAAKQASSRGSGKIEVGDTGIWATCARNMEGRATTELRGMFEECAERFYGIKPDSGEVEEADDEDIEAAIQREVASMTDKEKPKLFAPVHLDMVCVMFFKTRPPIDPVDFVHRICEEVTSKPGVRRMKYVNRLTPNSLIGQATEKGLAKLGKAVLEKHFQLTGEEEAKEQHAACSFAIRPTIRAHTVLSRDAVIQQVAAMIDGTHHKVDLTAPDKIIVIDVYQSICGMSVVGSDWEALKRFNLAELYKPIPKAIGNQTSETTPEPAKTGEAQSASAVKVESSKPVPSNVQTIPESAKPDEKILDGVKISDAA